MLKAVITADIVNSRKEETKVWLATMKDELTKMGKEPQDWEIYRGDSLQLMIPPKIALRAAFQIRATIMQHKSLDLRMGIGIGEVSHQAEKITESNGSAFVYSGRTFDALSKDEMMKLKSPWEDFDETMNLLLSLIGKLMSGWNTNRALIVRKYLHNPHMTQRELGELLNKQQSNISHSLNKAGYDELTRVLRFYESYLQQKIKA